MKTEKRMFISFLLNFIFTFLELIGGLITNSIALISDSVHDLGDSITLGLSIILEKKSHKSPDNNYTFGYRRFSLLGALISAFILVIGSSFVIYEAINRLLHPEPINSELVIYFAIFGFIINGIAAMNTSKGKSINEKVITLHLLEDVFGWLALLIASIIMYYTDIIIIDALLSLAFTVVIMYQVYKSLKEILAVFLEKAPKGFNIDLIKEKILKISHVADVTKIYLWSLDGIVPLITVYVTLNDNLTSDKIIEVQNNIIKALQLMDINNSALQIEFESNKCIDNISF